MFRAIVILTLFIVGALIIAGVTGLSFSLYEKTEFFIQKLFTDSQYGYMFFTGLIIMIFLPLVSLVLGGLAILLGLRHRSKWLGYLVFFIWLTSFFLVLISGYTLIKEFKHKAIEYKVLQHPINQNKTFIIKQKSEDSLFGCNAEFTNIKHVFDFAFIDCNDNIQPARKVTVEVVRSIIDSIRVEVISESRGNSINKAREYAKLNMVTPIITDSSLTLPRFSFFESAPRWRNQKVKVIVHVPEKQEYRMVDENMTVIE